MTLKLHSDHRLRPALRGVVRYFLFYKEKLTSKVKKTSVSSSVIEQNEECG